MRRSLLSLAACLAAAPLAMTLVASPEAGQGAGQQPPPAFNASQAASGATVYAASCASCHMADLGGRNEAPQLAGNNFMSAWRNRSTKDLFEFIQSTMPPTGENLSAAQYLAVTAYILQANGAAAGEAALTATTAVPIGAIATGATPTAAAAAAPPVGRGGAGAAGRGAQGAAGQAPGAGRGGAPANAGPLGLTVTGTVKNYTPVTDEMLRNQDPGDWLMARRNYQGWSHSPLTQITPGNARELQLVWSWGMSEGQGNEPSPLVHNGILYIVNIQNIVQALDARTGDLIWENHVGPNALIGQAAMRNMAIYQDKVFVATTDARLVALDARTGAKVWDTTIADRAKGYANTAGPMVMKGVVVNGLVGCDRYGNDGCWISGYDASTGKQLWKFNTVRRGTEQGADSWGKLADNLRIGGRHGSPAATIRISTSRTGASRRRSRGCGRAADPRTSTTSSIPAPLSRCGRRTARWHGTTSMRRENRSTSTKSSSASSSISAIRRSSSRSASRGSSGNSIAATASSSATRKRFSRTSSSRSIRRTARRPIAATSSSSRQDNGSTRVRAWKAATTGRR
jgi:alcohol dehydrogenase (cytochrome c)